MEKRADWKRLQVGDTVSGRDGQFGLFIGKIIKYERVYPVRKNLPVMFFATVVINEYGTTVKHNFSSFNEAYDETRPLVWSNLIDVPIQYA